MLTFLFFRSGKKLTFLVYFCFKISTHNFETCKEISIHLKLENYIFKTAISKIRSVVLKKVLVLSIGLAKILNRLVKSNLDHTKL